VLYLLPFSCSLFYHDITVRIILKWNDRLILELWIGNYEGGGTGSCLIGVLFLNLSWGTKEPQPKRPQSPSPESRPGFEPRTSTIPVKGFTATLNRPIDNRTINEHAAVWVRFEVTGGDRNYLKTNLTWDRTRATVIENRRLIPRTAARYWKAAVLICHRLEPQTSLFSRYSDWLRAGRPRDQSSSPDGVKNFLGVQTGSGIHPASYPMGTGGKAAGEWSWPLQLVSRSIKCWSIHPFPHTPSWRSA
jgi:hypothetical protein